MLTSFCGGRLFGAVFGEGAPAVVALPGWARDHGDFESVGNGLEVGLLAVDLPGFGSTPPPSEPWDSARYAEELAGVVQEAGPPLVVLGHSFGGRVALRLAAARPELVRALVLTGAPVARPPSASGGRRAAPGYRAVRFLHRRGLLSDARLEAARGRYGSADYRGAVGVMREVLVKAVNESYDDALRRVACPVELVWGDDDRECPPAVAEEIARQVPAAHLTVVPGAGHLLPLSSPGILRDAIQRSLS